MAQAAADIEYLLSTEEKLKAFVNEVLAKLGVASSDAATVADVLVAADLRGIESHGVARLESYYVSRIRKGKLNPRPEVKVAHETETSIVLDADNGLGHPVGKRAMLEVIEKAKRYGSAFGDARARTRHDRHRLDELGPLRRTDVRQAGHARNQPVRLRDSSRP